MTKHGRGTKSPMEKGGSLRRVMLALVVLLAACLVLVVPGLAATEYYASPDGTGDGTTTPDSLGDILTTLKTADTGDYIVHLSAGTYAENYDIVRTKAAVNIILQPASDAEGDVTFTGTVRLYNTGEAQQPDFYDETVTFKGLKFTVPNSNLAKSIHIAVVSNGNQPGNIIVDSCTFTGTSGTTCYGIIADTNSSPGSVTIKDSQFTDISHSIQGKFGVAKSITISGCTITGANSGINLQAFGDQYNTVVTIEGNTITASDVAVRLGSKDETKITGKVTVEDNTLTVTDTSSTDAALVIRGKEAKEIVVQENTVEAPPGVPVFAVNELTTMPETMTFTTNNWNGVDSDYPSPSDVNTGTNVIVPWKGDGTGAETAYQIASKSDLEYLAAAVNGGESYNGKYFKVTQPIDLNNEEWTPIGNSYSNTFGGIFDGGDNTISNLKISSGSNSGLFGYAGSEGAGFPTIKNVKLHNVDIAGTGSVGSLAGYLVAGDTITNCHVTGTIKVSSSWASGGLVGMAYASFEDCTVTGETGSFVTTSHSDNYDNSAGGLIGHLGETYGGPGYTITNCHANIDVVGCVAVGGLIGVTQYGNLQISDSSSTGTVTLSYDDKIVSATKQQQPSVGSLIGLTIINTDVVSNQKVTVTESSSTADVIVDSQFTTNKQAASAGFIGGTLDWTTTSGSEPSYNDDTNIQAVTTTDSVWVPADPATKKALEDAGYLKVDTLEVNPFMYSHALNSTGAITAIKQGEKVILPINLTISEGAAYVPSAWDITVIVKDSANAEVTGLTCDYILPASGLTATPGTIANVATVNIAGLQGTVEGASYTIDITLKTTVTVAGSSFTTEETISGISAIVTSDPVVTPPEEEEPVVTPDLGITVTVVNPAGYSMDVGVVSTENKATLEGEAAQFNGYSFIYAEISLLDTNGSPDSTTQATFRIGYPAAWGINANNYQNYNFVVLHLKGGVVEVVPATASGDGLTVTSTLSPFAIGYSVKQTGGSSYTQGSSVWLTESQTPTQTPEQPTDKPTDSVPTDIPTTQPTPTQTESPGFGVLAVLGALGAVAVLRRK